MDLTEEKQFPQNYSSDATSVLRAMTLTGGKGLHLVGSMALRSQQYAGDFDAYEDVESSDGEMRALDNFAGQFKSMIKELRGVPNTFIADIKAGVVPNWQVIPTEARIVDGKIVDFNVVAARSRLDEIVREKAISPAEAKEYGAMLKDSLSPEEFLIAKATIKPHVMRWTVAEVLQGYKVLQDKSHYSLQDAFNSPGRTKVDAISWMNGNHFAEFSCIYNFYAKGKWLNAEKVDVKQGLMEDIASYTVQGKPFKAMKRRFALAKAENDTKTMATLQPILNGDLGRIYSLAGDIGTLLYMLDNFKNVPDKAVDFEIDQFRDRFSRIYGIKDFIYAEPKLLGQLAAAMRAPRSSRGRAIMRKHLAEVEEALNEMLRLHTPKNI